MSTAGLVALSSRPYVGSAESSAEDKGVCLGDQCHAEQCSRAHRVGQQRLLSPQSLMFDLLKCKGAQVPLDRRAVGSTAQGLPSVPPMAWELGADGQHPCEALTAGMAGE